MSMMISFDDAIELFKELGQYVKAEEAGKYDCAIKRLNYENEKAKGVEVKKIRKIREKGYIVRCGNCGNQAIKEVWYKYCPNCGYKVIRKD